MTEVLEDVATGVYSVLEHRYLTRVERPHGLPTARRQRVVRAGRGPAYRDVEYPTIGLVVELDGRLGHDWPKTAGMTWSATSPVSWPVTPQCGWAGGRC